MTNPKNPPRHPDKGQAPCNGWEMPKLIRHDGGWVCHA